MSPPYENHFSANWKLAFPAQGGFRAKTRNKKIPPMDPELNGCCLIFPGNVPDAVESNPTRCETGLRYIFLPVENPFARDRVF